MSEEHDSWLGGIGVNVKSFFEDAAQKVEDAGSAVVHKAEDIGGEVVNGAKSVVQKVEDVGSAAVKEVEDLGGEVVKEAKSVVQKVEDAGSAAVKKVEDFGGEVVEDAKSVVQKVEDIGSTVLEKVEDFGGEVLEGAKGVVQKVEDAGSAVLKKVKDFGAEVLEDGKKAVEYVEETAEDLYQGQVHSVDARPLSAAELADAKVIFGNSLDYSKVVVDGGSVASVQAGGRTIGNSVHLHYDLFVAGTSETTDEGKRVLVHELTHVWQYQHQGWTYAPKALWAQATQDDAYDWRKLVSTPWEQWNPEAQAAAVEDYNRALHKVNDGTASKKDYDDLALLQEFVEKLVAGPGT